MNTQSRPVRLTGPMNKIEQLEALYATIPQINCKRLCGVTNCGPIQMTTMEFVRIEEKIGFMQTENEDFRRKNPTNYTAKQFQFLERPYHLPRKEFMEEMKFLEPYEGTIDCRFLVPTIGTCRIYALRPLICRLWGAVDHPQMRCRFGCIPERWVTSEEARQYFRDVLKIQKGE